MPNNIEIATELIFETRESTYKNRLFFHHQTRRIHERYTKDTRKIFERLSIPQPDLITRSNTPPIPKVREPSAK